MRRLVALAVLALGLTIVSATRNTTIETVVVATTSTTEVTYPMNPFALEDLGADLHDTESSIPELAVPPVAITRASTAKAPPTTVVLPEGKCDEWYPEALEAGWGIDQLTKVGRIAWAESRCTPDIANKTYSYGLMQIEWSAHKGWLKSEFGITDREALFDPVLNLQAAKWLFDYAEEHYGCGWQPWYMSGEWC